MLDLTLTPDRAMPELRYKTRTFTRRYSSPVWCVFTRNEQGVFIGSQGWSCGKNRAGGGAAKGLASRVFGGTDIVASDSFLPPYGEIFPRRT
jgi:hypothetical protein